MNTITTLVNCEKSLFSTVKLIKSVAISTFIQKLRKSTKFNLNKEEIKLIQADKGGKIVIINKNDCFNKIREK